MNRIPYIWDLVNATTNQNATIDGLNRNEFVRLLNCKCDERSVKPRPRDKGISMTYYGGQSVLSASLFNNLGVNGNWLLMAVNYKLSMNTNGVALYAMLVNRGNGGETLSFDRVRMLPSASLIPGLPWHFWAYRGIVYASNGFEMASFDGYRWTAQDAATQWQTIAARYGAEIFSAMYLIGTPHYPGEVTRADPFLDVPLNTDWRGALQTAGGAGTVLNLNGFDIIQSGGDTVMYVTGDAQCFMVSRDGGQSWKKIVLNPTWYAPLLSITLRDLASGQYTGWATFGTATVIRRDETSPVIEKWLTHTVRPSSAGLWKAQCCVIVDSAGFIFTIFGGEHDSTSQPGANKEPTIAYTTDEGSTWNSCYVSQGGDDLNQQVSAVAVTIDNTYAVLVTRAVDGNLVPKGSIRRVALPLDHTTEWTVVEPTGGGRSEDIDYYGLCTDPVSGKMYACGFCPGASPPSAVVHSSTDSGATWGVISTIPSATPAFYAISAYSGSAWAVGASGTILKWDGANWTSQTSGVTVDLHSVKFTSLLDGYAVGDLGTFIFTHDGGDTWMTPSNPRYSKTRFRDNIICGGNEEIRGFLKRGGLLFLFTNHNIINVNPYPSMLQQVAVEGFEIPHQSCICEWNGDIWLFGKYNGVPGAYTWGGGTEPPVLHTRGIKDEMQNALLDPCFRMVNTIWDSEQDFTPHGASTQWYDIGIKFDATRWTYLDGLLTLKRSQSGTVFSHSTDGVSSSDRNGIYIPGLQDWGFVCLEGAINDNANASVLPPSFALSIRLNAHSALNSQGIEDPEKGPDPATWATGTGWFQISPQVFEQVGQGYDFGRPVYRIPQVDSNGIKMTTYKWLQWKVQATNTLTGNVIVNRIAIRSMTRMDNSATGAPPSIPSLLASGDTLRAFYDVETSTPGVYEGRCLNVTTKGNQYSVTTEEFGNDTLNGIRGVSAVVNADGSEILGFAQIDKPNGRVALNYLLPESEMATLPDYTQDIITGRISDFGTNDPVVAASRKDLKTLRIGIKPAPWIRGIVTVDVMWTCEDYFDDDTGHPTNGYSTLTLTFPRTIVNDEIADQNEFFRVVELAPDNAVTGTGQVQMNSGRMFQFRIKGHSSADQFELLSFAVEAVPCLVTQPSDYQEH